MTPTWTQNPMHQKQTITYVLVIDPDTHRITMNRPSGSRNKKTQRKLRTARELPLGWPSVATGSTRPSLEPYQQSPTYNCCYKQVDSLVPCTAQHNTAQKKWIYFLRAYYEHGLASAQTARFSSKRKTCMYVLPAVLTKYRYQGIILYQGHTTSASINRS